MIALSNTTEILELDTRIAARLDVVISYGDHTSTTYAANGSQSQITTAANTTILAAPAAATQRVVLHLSITNIDILTTQFFLLKDVSGTDYRLTHLVTLKAGESLHYNSEGGWTNYDWNGRPRQPGLMPWSHYEIFRGPLASQFSVSGGSDRSIPSGTTIAAYVGRAPQSARRVLVKYRVDTEGATVTWGEIGVATGIPSIGNNATLTVLGVNTSNNPLSLASVGGGGSNTSANGVYKTMVELAPGYQINEGDDVWMLFGNSATTGVIMRAGVIPDDLSSGLMQTAETQPSLNIGTPILYTVDSSANCPLYLGMCYY